MLLGISNSNTYQNAKSDFRDDRYCFILPHSSIMRIIIIVFLIIRQLVREMHTTQSWENYHNETYLCCNCSTTTD